MYKDIYYSTVKVKKEIHIDSYIAIKTINDDNKLHPDLEQYYEIKNMQVYAATVSMLSFIFFKEKKIKVNQTTTRNHPAMCVSSTHTDKTLKTVIVYKGN